MTALLLLALLSGGCSSGQKATTPETGPATPAGGRPGLPAAGSPPATGSSGAATPLPPAPSPAQWLTLAPAPGALKRLLFPPGEMVKLEHESILFMDAETGTVEAWSIPSPSNGAMERAFNASPDGRWVVARDMRTGYLADRESGGVHAWDRERAELIAISGPWLLFEQVRTTGDPRWESESFGTGGHQQSLGSIVILNGDLQAVHQISLPTSVGTTAPRPALISPDGKQVVMVGGGALHLADLQSGAIREIGSTTAERLEPLGNGTGFATRFALADAGPLHTYGWAGERLAGPVPTGKLSPDGRLVAWRSRPDDFAPAVTISDVHGGQPLLRVMGAELCYGWGGNTGGRWLADGSRLLLRTREGLQMVSLSGQLEGLPGIDDSGWHEPTPAPGRTDRIADLIIEAQGTLTLAVLDEAGNRVAHARVDGSLQPVPLRPALGIPLWGEQSREVRLSMLLHFGRGGPCGEYWNPLPPAVQLGQPAEAVVLRVQGTGACLNLRQEPGLSAPVVTCLPDGTTMTLTRPGPPLTWQEEHLWVHLRTAAGEIGWASLTAGYVGWAH